MNLEGRTILVTGGASGIGKGVVAAAAAAGARVAVLDLDEAGARQVAAAHAGARSYRVDVTDAEGVQRVCQQVVADFGRLDGAVNNAGTVGIPGPLAETPVESWRKVLDVNLSGVFFGVRAQIPLMIRSGGGSIVNMASMAGVCGEENMVAYCASKHGVVGLTKVAALEYGRQGIRCNAVCPSYIKTPMSLAGIPEAAWAAIDAQHPIGRVVTVEEVAQAVVFLLSDASGGMTGSTHLLDGGKGAR